MKIAEICAPFDLRPRFIPRSAAPSMIVSPGSFSKLGSLDNEGDGSGPDSSIVASNCRDLPGEEDGMTLPLSECLRKVPVKFWRISLNRLRA